MLLPPWPERLVHLMPLWKGHPALLDGYTPV